MTPTRTEASVATRATYATYPSLLGVPVPARAFGLAAGWNRFDETAIAHEATTVSSQASADLPNVTAMKRESDRENRARRWYSRKMNPSEVVAA